MKILDYEGKLVTIESPGSQNFHNDFEKGFYNFCYAELPDRGPYKPYIDTDKLKNNTYAYRLLHEYEKADLKLPKLSAAASDKELGTIQSIVRGFFRKYPVFLGLFLNNTVLAKESIKNAEILLGETVSISNFIEIKSIIDKVNAVSWTRERNLSERQSGVSTLGTISEDLLLTVFDNLVDDINFFRVSGETKSYGDFVLVCMPNNLWLSVKSNFARERLLASGYSNDILGVGFFEDAEEFTSRTRMRNLKKSGFLAMYCPDVAVTVEQQQNNTNTYQEIIEFYQGSGHSEPVNINGNAFIRRLTNIHKDIQDLMSEKDLQKRTTFDF